VALGDFRAVAELRRDDRWWDSLNECLDRGAAGSPQVDCQSAESDHDGVRSQALTRADTWESPGAVGAVVGLGVGRRARWSSTSSANGAGTAAGSLPSAMARPSGVDRIWSVGSAAIRVSEPFPLVSPGVDEDEDGLDEVGVPAAAAVDLVHGAVCGDGSGRGPAGRAVVGVGHLAEQWGIGGAPCVKRYAERRRRCVTTRERSDWYCYYQFKTMRWTGSSGRSTRRACTAQAEGPKTLLNTRWLGCATIG
jgi:hypothetical protein